VTELIADLLLHPLRLRIVQALVERPLTATQMRAVLGDVAPATLYRQITQLETGGLIEIVDERRVRGGVERTYRVVDGAASLGADDLAGADTADHFRYFATFVGTLLTDYAGYLQRGSPDLEVDRVGYRQVPLWLSDEEFDELAQELAEALQRRLANEPRPERRRRLISTIAMPDDRSTENAAPSS
jgi:DNA-binding transcriptional ArsR family regulator